MKINSAILEVSATDLSSCPRRVLPEFAFIGRSNVGKSALINLLTGRRDLARVSGTPGKTQLLNFFLINESWRLVDLPGYGYANVAKEKRAEFNQAVATYIAGREWLSQVFVLIDSRLEPQAIDIEFIQWLEECDATFALIFTKTDKQSATQTQNNVARFKQALATSGRPLPEILLSSSKAKSGRSEILAAIESRISRRGGG